MYELKITHNIGAKFQQVSASCLLAAQACPAITKKVKKIPLQFNTFKKSYFCFDKSWLVAR